MSLDDRVQRMPGLDAGGIERVDNPADVICDYCNKNLSALGRVLLGDGCERSMEYAALGARGHLQLVQAMSMHLQSNHYPPIPTVWVGIAVKFVESWNKKHRVPKFIKRPKELGRAMDIPWERFVEAFHLDAFLGGECRHCGTTSEQRGFGLTRCPKCGRVQCRECMLDGKCMGCWTADQKKAEKQES